MRRRGPADGPEGPEHRAPNRRFYERDLPLGAFRVVLLLLVAATVVHLAALAYDAAARRSLAPLLAAATGADTLLTDLLGASTVVLLLAGKRQGNRTEHLAGRTAGEAAGLAGRLEHLAESTDAAVAVTEEALQLLTVIAGTVTGRGVLADAVGVMRSRELSAALTAEETDAVEEAETTAEHPTTPDPDPDGEQPRRSRHAPTGFLPPVEGQEDTTRPPGGRRAAPAQWRDLMKGDPQ